MKEYWVYILATGKNGTLYTGITSNISKRIYEHKNKLVEGFTKKYDVTMLVFAEKFEDADTAHAAEKKIKKWNRQWKINIIEEKNPNWEDLYAVVI